MHLTGELSGWAAAEGRDPQGRGHPHREGRHRRDRRVLRPRRRVDLGHRQGDDLQHGRRDRRDLLAVPLRRPRRPRTSRRPVARRSPTSPTRTPSTCASTPRSIDDPERFFDRVIDIDLDELEPHLVGPHTPDLDRPISEVGAAAREEGYPVDICYALVGSCTNSSYEDIGRAANVARQAQRRGPAGEDAAAHHAGLGAGARHDRARRPARRPRGDRRHGARQRVRPVHRPVAARRHRRRARRNTIVSSFNRNFPARNDGNAATLSFIGSPETVTAMALTGRLDVDFVREPVVAPDGTEVQLDAPSADELPGQGLRPRRVRVPAAGRRPVVGRGRGEARLRAARAARAVPGVGRQRLHRAAGADEGGRASAPPTTSRPPGRGCSTAATSPTSRATSSSA